METGVYGKGNATKALNAGRDIKIKKPEPAQVKIKRQIMPVHLYIHAVCLLIIILIIYRQGEILGAIEHAENKHDTCNTEIHREVGEMIKAANHAQDMFWVSYFNKRTSDD